MFDLFNQPEIKEMMDIALDLNFKLDFLLCFVLSWCGIWNLESAWA